MNWTKFFKVTAIFMWLIFIVMLSISLVFKNDTPVNTQPEIIRSYKVGDEPSIHRVWSVTVDGETIKYVEIVNDWR